MKRILIALAALATASLASASPSTDAASPSAQRSLRPEPRHVVTPLGLPSRFKGATVKLTFTIDAQGNVHDVAPVGRMPADLAKHLLPAIAQWKFSPMYENGQAVPVKVIFPLLLAEGAQSKTPGRIARG